jgi:aryl-alcohol dehydrogenase-like predicted oxidoreductase
LAYLPFFPLASGVLTGKYVRGESPAVDTRLHRWGDRAGELLTDANFDMVDSLRAWAEARDHDVLDLAVAWLVAKPFVTSVIAGATRPSQVAANAAAARWTLSAADVAEVDALGAAAQRAG